MRKTTSLLLAAALGCLTLLTPPASFAASADGRLVGTAPAAGTPDVLNGQVRSVAQVGNMMILGGTFTRARNDGSKRQLTRKRLLAFNATTGRISSTFTPRVNGAVRVIEPAGDGKTVYVGGQFTKVDSRGKHRHYLVRMRVSDGKVMGRFKPAAEGAVVDLRVSKRRLWVAGTFARISGKKQPALAAVDANTGRLSKFMRARITGIHAGGSTSVVKFDITPDGSRLVAVGNFKKVNGVTSRQLLMLSLTGRSAKRANFGTHFYEGRCPSANYTYTQDVDLSPDGTFFVVGTTGGYGDATACDTTARFETRAKGTAVQPSWVDYTGGDTTSGVEVTNTAVYVGGHQRWQNNPYAKDEAGPGAVPREGIAALDPSNGLPYSWNPTRARGYGVFDFLSTSRGLWVASDTSRLGNNYKVYTGRIALLSPNGTPVLATSTPQLPNNVYVAGTTSPSQLSVRTYDGSTPGVQQTAPSGALDWSAVRAAFMLNGWLYTALSDGSFTKQTFDGTTYGASVPVNTSDGLVPLTSWHDDVKAMTGMYYDSGRIYFTKQGSDQLFYRYFTAESDVVGAKPMVSSSSITGVDLAEVRGMFSTGTKLYWANAAGTLSRVDLVRTPQAARLVPGTAAVISGDGVWSGQAHFLYQAP